jgi:hypothetical protein
MRNDGYYWINIPGSGWIIGEYHNNEWYVTGCETVLPERYITEIDENQLTR